MSSPSRTSQFEKLFKILRKHYKSVSPDPNRSVLEHLLLACCLENASYQSAEAALAALVHEFYDWNEIRVSTTRELSEAMSGLPDPPAAANRVKRVLQHVFEGAYAFDLEEVRKLNLGPATERLAKIDGASRFCVAYVVQSALGGHSIPIDSKTMEVLQIVDLVSEEDAAAETVPGLERAISKSKGCEFGSLLHQLGADFTANPFSPDVRAILVQINPDAKERLPRRRSARKAAAAGDGRDDGAGKPAASETAAAEQPAGPKRGRKGAAEPAKPTAKGKQAEARKPRAAKKPAPAPKETTSRKRGAKGGQKPASQKKAASGKAKARDGAAGKTAPAGGLSKKKPR